MDIFVTGASGYIGSALTRILVGRGHRVRGLARTAGAADKVRAAGGEPVRGELTDLAVLAAAAGGGDGVVHTAATAGRDRAAVDAAAVTAMLGAMAGEMAGAMPGGMAGAMPGEMADATPGGMASATAGGLAGGTAGRVFVTTTGAPRARSSREPVAEDDTAEVAGPLAWLAAAEARVLEAAGVRGAVVRPPMVYGDGGGPVAGLVGQARADGVARYAGDGANRWSTVHVADLAVAYAMVLESGASGVFHAAEAVAEPMVDVIGAVGEAAGVPVRSWPLREALQAHGPLAGFLAMDAALDAGRLRGLGWAPRFGEAVGGIRGALLNPAQGYTVSA